MLGLILTRSKNNYCITTFSLNNKINNKIQVICTSYKFNSS